jgi:tetratricopeptide (TPR) repeat protein
MRFPKGILTAFRPSGSIDPNLTFDDYLTMGNEYWIQRNFRKALKFYDIALEINPNDERPWNNKGIAYRNLGNIEEARKCFNHALQQNPNNSVIRRNLKSLDKPISSGTPLYGLGMTKSFSRIVPMLKYEIPNIMVTSVVLVSAILFISLFLIFKSSESYWVDNFQYLTLALTGVCTLIICIALIPQIHYLIPLIEYEIRIFFIFLLGVVIVVMVPIHESLGIFQTGEVWSSGNIALFVFGSIIITISTLWFYFKGGYFLAWLGGVIIFMTTSFHESFKFVVFTNSFGVLDQTTAVIGIVLTFIGLILFLFRKIVNIMLTRGENLRMEGRYEDALKYHNLILKLNPYNEVAWNDKGNVLYSIGNLDEAMECYQRALELDKNYDIAFHNLNIIKQSASPSG